MLTACVGPICLEPTSSQSISLALWDHDNVAEQNRLFIFLKRIDLTKHTELIHGTNQWMKFPNIIPSTHAPFCKSKWLLNFRGRAILFAVEESPAMKDLALLQVWCALLKHTHHSGNTAAPVMTAVTTTVPWVARLISISHCANRQAKRE